MSVLHYSSPNALDKWLACDNRLSMETGRPAPKKRPRLRGVVEKNSRLQVVDNETSSACRPVHKDADEDDDDFIIPPRNGNSITRYFAPAEKNFSGTKKNGGLDKVTVKADVHDSPEEKEFKKVIKGAVVTTTKVQARKKRNRRSGISGKQADLIEVVSSEELEQVPAAQPATKEVWKVKIIDDFQESSEDVDSGDGEGPRRSTRLRFRLTREKPAATSADDEEGQPPKKQKRVRQMRLRSPPEEPPAAAPEPDIEIVAEDSSRAAVAPIFLRRGKRDSYRAVQKAKLEFLHSGVPEALRQQQAVQAILQDRPVELFPKISHVLQCPVHRLPYPSSLDRWLKCGAPKSDPAIKFFNLGTNKHRNTTDTRTDIRYQGKKPCLEWSQCKEWIEQAEDGKFPFRRTLRRLLSKAADRAGYLWTDKYAPAGLADVFLNKTTVAELSQWLKQWKAKAGEQQVAARTEKTVGKRKRVADLTSESEWADSDGGGSSSCGGELCNSVLLAGPAGSGKTSSVYALAEELSFNVLEVNASSKRNGKSILSQLHEATQSHTVNSGASNGAATLNRFFSGSAAPAAASLPAEAKQQQDRTALSLVLFEDVDIVFESEDENFYSALSTLMNTSKRPIVMTVSSDSDHVLIPLQERIRRYFNILHYESAQLDIACNYLWCVCLAEGCPVDRAALRRFLETRLPLDLRSVCLELQLQLDKHPLRVSLNFQQLHPKDGAEPVPKVKKRRSNQAAILMISDLPSRRLGPWPPYDAVSRTQRFVNDDHLGIVPVAAKVMDEDLYETEKDPLPERKSAPPPEMPPVAGDLNVWSGFFDTRANQDLMHRFQMCQDPGHSILDEIQCIVDEVSRSKVPDVGVRATWVADGSHESNKYLLDVAIADIHQTSRRSCFNDLLPYTRSIIRSELCNGASKRRRQKKSADIRIAALDSLVPVETVLSLANAL